MNLKAIGSRIKAAREKKGLTQEALSEIVDLSPMHMSVIERGVKPTRLDTFIRIANALDVSADELLQDVVDHSTESISGELYDMIQQLPKTEQQKILYMFHIISFRSLKSYRHLLVRWSYQIGALCFGIQQWLDRNPWYQSLANRYRRSKVRCKHIATTDSCSIAIRRRYGSTNRDLA